MLLTLTRILDEQPPIWLISLNQSRGKCQMLLYYIYAVYTQRPITLQITSKWCYYKLMGLNYLKNKKHCCINGIMKNKKFLLIQAFYDTIRLVQALFSLSLFFFGFLNFSSAVLKAFITMASKAEIPKVTVSRCCLAVLKNFEKSQENTCIWFLFW